MFLISKDIGISLQCGKLHGVVCQSGERITVELEDLSFSRGKALRKEAFERALKELFSSLVSKLKLIPPRVLFTGYLESDGESELVKNSIIQAGSRELWILQRAMAACLGNEGQLGEREKRVYLLWDDGVLECAALEGVQTISLIRLETERICSLNSNFEFTAICEAEAFTREKISYLASHLGSLREYGFPVESPFFWSPSDPPKTLLDQISPLFLKLTFIETDAPLKGIIEVQKDLKGLIKGGFKK